MAPFRQSNGPGEQPKMERGAPCWRAQGRGRRGHLPSFCPGTQQAESYLAFPGDLTVAG